MPHPVLPFGFRLPGISGQWVTWYCGCRPGASHMWPFGDLFFMLCAVRVGRRAMGLGQSLLSWRQGKKCSRRDAIPEEDACICLGHNHLCTYSSTRRTLSTQDAILSWPPHMAGQSCSTPGCLPADPSACMSECLCSSAPAAPIATGACSREEPQPKFSPPMTTGYFVFISPSGMNLHSQKCVSHG